MATLAEFLEHLFVEGRVVFRERPVVSREDRDPASAVLRRTFADALMELAGPPLPFDEPTALRAADWTRRACWFLVSREEPPDELEKALALPESARTRSASEHLAADLTFRYLPAVHRRARAIDPSDPLARRLVDLFRLWPLSGVLSDIEDAPTSPIEFGGHDGLRLLYAERLVDHRRPAWVPGEGRSREFVELALNATGRARSPWLLHQDGDHHAGRVEPGYEPDIAIEGVARGRG